MAHDYPRVDGILCSREHAYNLSAAVPDNKRVIPETATVVGNEAARVQHGADTRARDRLVPDLGMPRLVVQNRKGGGLLIHTLTLAV
jgi:hypothetical protein